MDDDQDDAGASLPQPPPSPYRSLHLEGAATPPDPPPLPPPPPTAAAATRRLARPSSRTGHRTRPGRSTADRLRLVLVIGIAVLVLIAFVRGVVDDRPDGSSSRQSTIVFTTTTTARDPSDAFCTAYQQSTRVVTMPAVQYVALFDVFVAETRGRI